MTSQVLGETTTYTYDTASRLLNASTPSGSGAHVNEWSWHPNNALARARTVFSSGGTDTEIADYEYVYDNNRNIVTQAVSGTVGTYASNYEYSPAQQLTKWTYAPSPGTAKVTTYGYDRNNNRTSQKVDSGDPTIWDYRLDNSINFVNGPVSGDGDKRTYTYNDDGLLHTDGCVTNTYDAFDRVKQVTVDSTTTPCPAGEDTTTSYTYDGLDRQRAITVTGSDEAGQNTTTKDVYDGLTTTVVGQYNAVNGAFTQPEVLYQLDAGGNQYAYDQANASAGKAFLDTDGHGNVTAITTAPASGTGGTGVLGCGVVYDPYGNPYQPDSGGNGICANGSQKNTTGNAAWYRGLTRDGSTGTYQMGTRTYDPDTGAFTTPDSYRVASPSTDLSVGTDPLTANTYTYVNGNPVNMIDPMATRRRSLGQRRFSVRLEPELEVVQLRRRREGSGRPQGTRRPRNRRTERRPVQDGEDHPRDYSDQ